MKHVALAGSALFGYCRWATAIKVAPSDIYELIRRERRVG
jgi:hypothetical protein